MMLLLDFAVARLNRSGGKKNHGDHSNNNTDRESVIIRMLQLQATVKRFQVDLYVNLEGQHMLISSWSQR